MADSPKQKDWWDKIAAITPLILGLAVTGVATLFTQIYNFHQLQLNQIVALDKLRPLLTSDKPEEREFGYASFAALGYKDIAIQIIKVKQDQSGRPLLNELAKSGSPEIRDDAKSALKGLDEANRLVNISEFGTPNPSKDLIGQHPELDPKQRVEAAAWSVKTAKQLGISSKLGTAILLDAAVFIGTHSAEKLQEAASGNVSPPLDSREKETAWLNQFLDVYDERLKTLPSSSAFYRGYKARVDRLRNLVKDGDWDLTTVGNKTP